MHRRRYCRYCLAVSIACCHSVALSQSSLPTLCNHTGTSIITLQVSTHMHPTLQQTCLLHHSHFHSFLLSRTLCLQCSCIPKNLSLPVTVMQHRLITVQPTCTTECTIPSFRDKESVVRFDISPVIQRNEATLLFLALRCSRTLSSPSREVEATNYNMTLCYPDRTPSRAPPLAEWKTLTVRSWKNILHLLDRNCWYVFSSQLTWRSNFPSVFGQFIEQCNSYTFIQIDTQYDYGSHITDVQMWINDGFSWEDYYLSWFNCSSQRRNKASLLHSARINISFANIHIISILLVYLLHIIGTMNYYSLPYHGMMYHWFSLFTSLVFGIDRKNHFPPSNITSATMRILSI